VGRANFVATVRAWRSNQAALQQAIQARMGVSQAETNAFLNAQNKVTSYLQKFMNGSGWFHDAPIPEDVRAQVDGPLKAMYGALAEDLKDRLNAWEVAHSPPEANLFFDTLRAFSAGMQEVEDGAQRGAEVMRTFVHAATRVGIGFVPFVGPALDLCEAVTGREWCTPSGRELTTGERVWSGIGFGAGKLVKVWKGIAKAGISAEGKLAAAGVVTLGDKLGNLAKSRFLNQWRTLKYTDQIRPDLGALTPLTNIYEREAFRRLLEDQGHHVLAHSDKAVKDLLGLGWQSPTGSSMACDFITVKNDMLVLSEVKGYKEGKIDIEHALQQLRNVMKALQKKEVVNGVERVQIFVPPGSGGIFNGAYVEKAGQLLDKNNMPVTLKGQGRPDLIVQVVEMAEL
ncbi:MAG TPA: pre-toxin TG domain-containing protein, partial [Polyangium sp.]|nr:pre-toxin TG domain-containing protein [Polyangium sp.]